jgi:hypothetical protein
MHVKIHSHTPLRPSTDAGCVQHSAGPARERKDAHPPGFKLIYLCPATLNPAPEQQAANAAHHHPPPTTHVSLGISGAHTHSIHTAARRRRRRRWWCCWWVAARGRDAERGGRMMRDALCFVVLRQCCCTVQDLPAGRLFRFCFFLGGGALYSTLWMI